MSVQKLGALVHRAQRVLVFTGAGISTGSGIPDFRGPRGVWKRWRPVYYDEFMSSQEARNRHWKYKLEGWNQFREAKPNAAHRALVELDRMGRLDVLVTQNIDGLHQLAGHPQDRVVELHGTNRWIECQSCQHLFDPEPFFEEFVRTRQSPECKCGGFLKSATISFGQAMPVQKIRQALDAAKRADLVMVIGSTLEVEPAGSIPRTAKENGAIYVIINQGVTAQDDLADLRIEGDALQVLPEAVEHLTERISNS